MRLATGLALFLRELTCDARSLLLEACVGARARQINTTVRVNAPELKAMSSRLPDDSSTSCKGRYEQHEQRNRIEEGWDETTVERTGR